VGARSHRFWSAAVTRAVYASALCSWLALAAVPHVAQAFSDPAAFGDEVAMGGGGGRFFTGSPADGFGCDVCHGEGPQSDLLILGLPVTGYQAGTAYEVQVQWSAQLEHVGLALELTDDSGHGAGTLRLPPADELPEPERCEPVEDGLAAGVLTELDAQRTILSVPDCGAKRVRFLWTAPADARGAVALSGGLVVSNAMADYGGDTTTMFTRALAPLEGGPAVAADTRAQCNAGVPRRGRWPLPSSTLLTFSALLVWRARKRRCA
jgi:hypothetical protein